MALSFYNTLTQQLEEFAPIDPPCVRLYTCGPTVYDYAHIGNFRTYVFEDLLRRVLEARGYAVTHVMNITDVEDKIIRAVQREKIPLAELTGRFTQAFFDDRDRLGIHPAHHYPLATQTLPEMIRLIETLLAKGIAYQSEDGSIYYSIAKFPAYGQLAHLHLDELKPGARVKQDEYEKETATDFALWKAWSEADGEVVWESPWGRGRPGWHIECSAMAMKLLGEQLDIHCGGVDNIFPHHQNEIAQSEPCTGKTFVRYWMHSAHLQVEGQKMSKKLGNFYTLRDLMGKGWTGREIRYALLSVHYRLPLNFTFDGLHAARAALQRMDEFLLKLQELAETPSPSSSSSSNLEIQFFQALDDDLNISGALGHWFEFIRETNKRLDAGEIGSPEAAALLVVYQKLDAVLGLGLPKIEAPPELQQLLGEREAARKARDFKRSDTIRAELKAKGWLIEDTAKGPRLKKEKP